jgi:hypothetical protein
MGSGNYKIVKQTTISVCGDGERVQNEFSVRKLYHLSDSESCYAEQPIELVGSTLEELELAVKEISKQIQDCKSNSTNILKLNNSGNVVE